MSALRPRLRYLGLIVALAAVVAAASAVGASHSKPYHDKKLFSNRWHYTVMGGDYAGWMKLTMSQVRYNCDASAAACEAKWDAPWTAAVADWNGQPMTVRYNIQPDQNLKYDVNVWIEDEILGMPGLLGVNLTYDMNQDPCGGVCDIWFEDDFIGDDAHSGPFGTANDRRATIGHELGHGLALRHESVNAGETVLYPCGQDDTGVTPHSIMSYNCIDPVAVGGLGEFDVQDWDVCGVNHAYADPGFGHALCEVSGGGGPQLIVKSIDFTPAKPIAGQPADVDIEISNIGGAAGGPFVVDFYQDRASAPPLLEVGDFFCDIGNLDPAASTTCSGQVTYGSAGSYDAWAQVDTDDEVAEDNENDNVFGPQKVAVNALGGQPDLVIDSVVLTPPKPTTGNPGDVDVNVSNIGNASTGPYFIDFYQDLPGAPFPSEIGDMACDMPSLAAGESDTCSGTVTYGAPGSYDAWAQADTDQEVNESNEGNNIEGPQKVDVNDAADHDLVVKSIDLSPVKPETGQVVDVDIEISNLGSDPVSSRFFVDFYEDLAGAPLPFEIGNFSCEIFSLGAGASTTCSGTVSYGSAGSYDVWAQVDTDLEISETNEANNVMGPEKVDVNGPAVPTSTPTPAPAPTFTPTPVGPPVLIGDADCSGAINSIDAAVILQFAAFLLGAVPCPDNADANLSGVVDVIDATLILQFAAGFLATLPP